MMKFVYQIKYSQISRLKRNICTSGWFCSDELFAHRDSQSNNPQTPFDFSQANLKRLSAIIQNYPEGAQRSAISAAMDIVQRQIGWIPISAMHKVAEILSMPRMRVYEWATFYTMTKRRFRGKFNVKVCVTTPCMLRGSDIILAAVEELTCCSVGGVSRDGMFGVDTVQCQGACVNAPVMVVDDDYYEDVNVSNVHDIIQTLKCGGIPPWGPQLSAIIQNYPEGAQRSAISAAMDIVQRQIGWIPISAMHKVAEILSMPRMRVYEWATFYTMTKRRFRGKFNVKVCVTTPCMLRGSDFILAAAEELTCCRVGGVSRDGVFGVDTVQCQGACVNAPVMVVDDDYYEDVNVSNVHDIIQTLKCGGIPPWGPQVGRFSCEPITGLTTLFENPPPPGYGLQPSLCGSPSI